MLIKNVKTPPLFKQKLRRLCRNESDLYVAIQSLKQLRFTDPDTRLDFTFLETSLESTIRYEWKIDDGRIVAIVHVNENGTAYVAELKEGKRKH